MSLLPLLILGILGVLIVVARLQLWSFRGLDYVCGTDLSLIPAGIDVMSSRPPQGALSAVPLGLNCTYFDPRTGQSIVILGGADLNLIFVGSLIVLALWVWLVRKRRTGRGVAIAPRRVGKNEAKDHPAN